MAVSRFRTRLGCYYFGRIRRSDFLPVGEEGEDEVLERGYYSVDSSDDEERGREYRFADQTSVSDEASEPAGAGVCSIDLE